MSLLRTVLAFMLAAMCCAAHAVPPLVVPDGRLGVAGSAVAPNFLLNLSLTFEDAAAAYRGAYYADVDYAGYFNAGLCYRYPETGKAGGARHPDLDHETGYFAPLKAADAQHECGGDSFSGNFLNWATMTTLDLLRYGLTGGDRVIDEAGRTVLQRAWLPDGAHHADFYAHPQYFARKSVQRAQAVTPFGVEHLYVISCRDRVMFSATGKGRSCDAPRFGAGSRPLVSDKHFGEFNVRVSVCGAAEGDLRPDLCRAYGKGFKPEGSMQQAAPRARIGIMSYLTERGAGDPNLYGGALRAPLASIASEWDSATGIGKTGGAIDFVNRLGRSNPARLGAYKGADPGAELYYEALRYLQGRPPSFAGAPARDDALPVFSQRADPVQAACQRNVIATIGHPAFAFDRHVPGNTRSVQNDQPRGADGFAPAAAFDVMLAARKVGDMEADPGRSHGNAAPRADLLRLDTLDDGPAGAGSFYLAGAAYWAHTSDIRPDQAVRVDSVSLELGAPARAGGSALYLAAKYGAFNDRNKDGNPYVTIGKRRDNSEWSGDGSTPTHFHAAHDASQVIGAVRALFAGSAGASPNLAGAGAIWRDKTDGSSLIETSFDLGAGSGRLTRRTFTVDAGGKLVFAATPLWDAADQLGGDPAKRPPVAPSLTPAQRKIFTMTQQGGRSATIPFRWEALPSDLRALLTQPDGLGPGRTAWLRGDRSGETGQPGGVFRRRSGLLGDIVNSVPLVVGPPSPSHSGEGYAAFRERLKGRAPVVYVGANDGMLHAFNARDGAELFAYIPHALHAYIGSLSSPRHVHRAYVDGSPGQGEARIGGQWKSVLASGMGMGARGVFALDVSSPGQFGDGAGALWEFTERDDPAMGHVQPAPHIARLRIGTTDKVALYRDFVITASGINNLKADGAGALFLLALDKAPDERWRRGLNYFALPAPASDNALPNALSAPALVTDADGSARYAYAGDLQGNLWRFDLTVKPPWAAGEIVFTARDAKGLRQPIAHAPRVVFAPGGGYLVLFGTGKFIENTDAQGPFAQQSFYAVHDTLAAAAAATRAQLAPRTLDGRDAYAVTGDPVEYGGPGGKRGWYLDFPNAAGEGERAAGMPSGAAGAVIFDTLLPGADECGGAASRSYVLDAVSGFAFDADGAAKSGAATAQRREGATGLPPLLIETGLLAGSSTPTGRAAVTRNFALIAPQPNGETAVGQKFGIRFQARRLGWREVSNWQDLHDAAKK